MPLPLPDLDTRRWADLVEEARALIPRFAPGWTDHNVHDPGIMLVELLAWLTEQDVYRANRVPARHRSKFLHLLGYPPRPPQPAGTYLSFRLDPTASPLELAAGTVFSTVAPAVDNTVGPSRRFRTSVSITVCGLGFLAVQRFDGKSFTDLTVSWRDRLPLSPWGTDPQAAGSPDRDPALYLGFDRPVPVGVPVRLWLGIDAAPDERDRHHAVRTVWEVWDGTHWHALDPDQGQLADRTRGLTAPGPVVLTLPTQTAPTQLGAAAAVAHYVRCRLVRGRPDAAPELLDVVPNAVAAEQVSTARSTLPVADGLTVPTPGPAQRRLVLTVDPQGTVTAITEDPAPELPPVQVLAATTTSVTLTLVLLGHGSGAPHQRVRLPDSPVAGDSMRLWTTDGGAARTWRRRSDLDASGRLDADFVLDTSTSEVVFGDGERGEVVPPGAAIFASYDVTAAEAGNVPGGSVWTLAGADDEINRVLLGVEPAQVTALVGIANRSPASGGAAEETADHAAGRAAETLWAHERIAELRPADGTLDQLDRAEVLSRAAPQRATTLLDFERLALEVPGTGVARARAWAGLDPRYPGVSAPGTVTVVVVPSLPVGRPQPTPGLLGAVRQHLDQRRVICTRLVVTGPEYLRVTVRARVAVSGEADPERVRQDVVAAMNRFLDPLVGGPSHRGWPFGRDVYRTEALQVIAAVPGVDHVRDLELRAGTEQAQCGNLCVPTTWLVTPGEHEIETERS